MNLTGKVALVTGASSGIGAATAKKLAEAGMKVGLAARRIDRLRELEAHIREAGGEAIALEVDVADRASVAGGVARLLERFGPTDVLFNNAGLMPSSDVAELRVDEWQRMVDVNLTGVLNVTAAVLPQMLERRSGHIFNTSSIAGRKVFKSLVVYCATKHAVTAFSDGLRMEVGASHGIRVTCVQPGGVESELLQHTADPERRAGMEQLRARIRFLGGEDIASAVLFALRSPAHMTLAELFVMPTAQDW